MDIFVLGLNHKTAPVEVREQLSVPFQKTEEVLSRMQELQIFDERLILSTCNRTELYGAANGRCDAVKSAKDFLSGYAALDLSRFEDKLYVYRGAESVEHLFSVTSGLDSMVIGETEITGQVKEAYLLAHRKRQTGKVLNTLFQKSLKVAKNLRTQTRIGTGKVSVASVAVDLAEKIFGNLKNVRVMVIGTGDMSTQLVKAMISRGAFASIISSRHHDRAVALAAELGAEALAYDTYESGIQDTDILITATSAPMVLVREPQVHEWMRVRRDKPLFLIDVAVPRNIDITAEKLDNVYLYNIDDLRQIADQNLALRESELSACSELIQTQTRHFMDWFKKEFAV